MQFDFILDFLRTKSLPLIGVDISSSAVKMVEISDTGNHQYRLDGYVIEAMPKDAVVDGNITNLTDASETIGRAWRRLNTKVKNVALALPSAAVITKKIIVPQGLREQELEMQVESEANQYIPFALDEVNLDFQVAGPAPDQPEEIEVLIAASRKEKVDDRVAAAENAGLKAMIMDIEAFATQGAYALIAPQISAEGKNSIVAIVDIGATMMHVSVLHDNQPVYSREQPFGGNQLTQEIQRQYSLSAEEAEIAKRQGSGFSENFETDVLQPFVETLSMEVTRALQFFFSSTQYTQVDQILLGGGCAAISGLSEIVADRTRTSTRIANPFVDMMLSPRARPRQLAQDAPALLIACGLALRKFDPL